MWVFGKNEEPSDYRVEHLILIPQPTLEQLYAERRAFRKKRAADKQRDRITEFLKTCEQGMTCKQVADALDVPCCKVRTVVTYAKRKGWLIEGTRHSGLIRVAVE